MRQAVFVLALILCTASEADALGRRGRTSYYQPNYSTQWYPASTTESATVTDASFGSELLALHNAERARAGMPPLTLDTELTQEAHAAAAEQSRRGRLGHWLPIRGGSENAAWGQSSEREAHSSWMASSGHRRNILGPWSSVGFARVGMFWAARYR